MVKITAHYGITGPVPFLDVHIDRDNLLFLDPSVIRNAAGSDPLARRAHDLLVNFFEEVVRCRHSASAADQAKGLDLLQQLHEPNYTRLGMSSTGVGGKGFGAEMGSRLWDELGTNPACVVAALTRLEDLALLIDRVGDDLTSDMATRVVLEVLIDFTQGMMRQFPNLTHGQMTLDAQVWDATGHVWTTKTVMLPFFPPHSLLLVPKGWVFWRMLMDPVAFYNRHATETVKMERTVIDARTGKELSPSKASLKHEFPYVKGLNSAQTARYMAQNVNLVALYRAEVDAEYVPLDDAELERRTDQ